jgi:hypothetical protein
MLRNILEHNEAVQELFIEFKKAYDSVRKKVLYNIVIEIAIPMKLLRLIKTCWKETYNRVWVGKYLSETYPIKNVLKQGDGLLPLLYNFALDSAIRSFEINQDGLKINGKQQLLVYFDDVNILRGSVHTIR